MSSAPKLASCAVAAGILAASSNAYAWDVETLLDSGDPANRITIAILGDGYTDADQAKLTEDARRVVDGMFEHALYKEYKGLFNVKLVHVVSKESGISEDPKGTRRDTALGTHYHCWGIERLMCSNDRRVSATAAENVPEYGSIVVLGNSDKYGGGAGLSGVVTISRERSAAGVVTHELGHSMGFLADEYTTPQLHLPCLPLIDCLEPNITIYPRRERLKWRHWAEAETPLPTQPGFSPDPRVVGAYEGAHYQATGVFRPSESCKMRSNGLPFCPVCAEQMTRSLWQRVSTIDDLAQTGPSTWTVRTPAVTTTFAYRWSVDGHEQPETGPSLTLDTAAYGDGVHEIAVTVRDVTDRVRVDPKNVIEDRRVTHFSCGAGKGTAFLGAGGDGMGCTYEEPPRGAKCSASPSTAAAAKGWAYEGAAFVAGLSLLVHRQRRRRKGA